MRERTRRHLAEAGGLGLGQRVAADADEARAADRGRGDVDRLGAAAAPAGAGRRVPAEEAVAVAAFRLDLHVDGAVTERRGGGEHVGIAAADVLPAIAGPALRAVRPVRRADLDV